LNLSIAARAKELERVVETAVFTDATGKKIDTEEGVQRAVELLRNVRDRRHRMFIVGNGGSAAIAAHSTTDFVNVAKISTHTLHDSSLLTCMANDYGYENAYALLLKQMAGVGDAVVAISSSGKSQNIRNAAIAGKERGAGIITLSGFSSDNPLRKLGDINIWLDSQDYGMVEIGHFFVLHNVADRFGAEAKGR
jgi:D-sedoheptulose 7-phosphate isomerase